MLAILINSRLEEQLVFLRLKVKVRLNNVLLRVLAISNTRIEVEALIAMSRILGDLVVESSWRESQLIILLTLHFQLLGHRSFLLNHQPVLFVKMRDNVAAIGL